MDAPFAFDPLGTRANSLAQDFQADETVAAGFLMGQVDFDGWNVLAGVRVEQLRELATKLTNGEGLSALTVEHLMAALRAFAHKIMHKREDIKD